MGVNITSSFQGTVIHEVLHMQEQTSTACACAKTREWLQIEFSSYLS